MTEAAPKEVAKEKTEAVEASAGKRSAEEPKEAATSSTTKENTEEKKEPEAAEGTKAVGETSFAVADLPAAPKNAEGVIDEEILGQIRDMDEDEDDEVDREFSRGIVWGFFEQAEKTFGEMAQAIKDKDLGQLSSLGHFLKGSSAALGIVRVQAICETIQHNGKNRDEEVGEDISSEDALKRIAALLEKAKEEYKLAKAWLLKLYEA